MSIAVHRLEQMFASPTTRLLQSGSAAGGPCPPGCRRSRGETAMAAADEPASRQSTLTERQRKILAMIRETVAEHGYPPSIREIGEAVGLTSPSSVHSQLEALQRKGFIRRDPTKPRTI